MGQDNILQPEDVDESISASRGALKRTWKTFCLTTSIHGLKYTKDEDTNKYIRLLWYIITFVLFMCAILMMFSFYMDYLSNPTRMNMENDYAPISSLLFPATVVCPEVMFSRERSLEYIRTLILPNRTTPAEVSDHLGISYGFMYDDMRFERKQLELMDEVLTLNNLHILDFMENLSWKCDDLLFRCRFNDRIVPCDSLFQPIRTFVGYCCGFNLNQTGVEVFHNEKANAGHRNGLSLVLYYKDSLYDRVQSYSLGFKVLLQHANEYPSAHSLKKFIALNHEVFMAVRPTETFSSQAVKDMPMEERQCTYPYETELTYFHKYVAANCILNCRVAMSVKICGCYTYFFYSNRTSDRICTYRDIPCLVENFKKIIGRYRKDQCPCINVCERIDYSAGADSVPLGLNIPTHDNFYDGLKEGFSVLHIYMNSQVYRRIRHDLLSNMVTLVSNLGSAFSLFVGMSMVSAVEIIYFFTFILRKYYREECNAREKLLFKKQKALDDKTKWNEVIIKIHKVNKPQKRFADKKKS